MTITTAENDVKERLSIAYVTAVAARAGCQVGEPKKDKQSIDVTVRPISGSKVSIDLQLKSTSGIVPRDGFLAFDLPVKNYDDLRDPISTALHYLIVLVLPAGREAWLDCSAEALVLRRCAYWLDLRGRGPTANTDTIRVEFPLSQRFDVAALQAMMQDAVARIGPLDGEGV